MNPLFKFFATGADRPVLDDQAQVDRLYRRHRLAVMTTITLGYGIAYRCRLGLSVVKKPLIDGGIFTAEQLGVIGSAIFYGYAFGKLVNGFLADHADIKRFLATGIWSSAYSISKGLTFVGSAALVVWYGWRAGFFGPGILCVALAAAMGVIGGCSYIGAAVQERISGALIQQGTTLADGVRHYDFDRAICFWLGADAFPTYTPHSTHMRLHYPSANPDERVLTVTQTAGSFTPGQFAGLDARMWVINASARGEVGLDVIRALRKKGGRIVADAQGFVRTIGADGTLQFDSWPGKEEVLPLVDVLKTDHVEALALTGLSDKHAAAVTSLKLEAEGPIKRKMSDVEELIRKKYSPTQPN